jgi:hypothetical protein
MENEDHDYDVLPVFEPLVMQKMAALLNQLNELHLRRHAAELFIENVDEEICRAMDECEDSLQWMEDISNALRGRPRRIY